MSWLAFYYGFGSVAPVVISFWAEVVKSKALAVILHVAKAFDWSASLQDRTFRTPEEFMRLDNQFSWELKYQCSDNELVNVGVPQSSVLSPLFEGTALVATGWRSDARENEVSFLKMSSINLILIMLLNTTYNYVSFHLILFTCISFYQKF